MYGGNRYKGPDQAKPGEKSGSGLPETYKIIKDKGTLKAVRVSQGDLPQPMEARYALKDDDVDEPEYHTRDSLSDPEFLGSGLGKTYQVASDGKLIELSARQQLDTELKGESPKAPWLSSGELKVSDLIADLGDAVTKEERSFIEQITCLDRDPKTKKESMRTYELINSALGGSSWTEIKNRVFSLDKKAVQELFRIMGPVENNAVYLFSFIDSGQPKKTKLDSKTFSNALKRLNILTSDEKVRSIETVPSDRGRLDIKTKNTSGGRSLIIRCDEDAGEARIYEATEDESNRVDKDVNLTVKRNLVTGGLSVYCGVDKFLSPPVDESVKNKVATKLREYTSEREDNLGKGYGRLMGRLHAIKPPEETIVVGSEENTKNLESILLGANALDTTRKLRCLRLSGIESRDLKGLGIGYDWTDDDILRKFHDSSVDTLAFLEYVGLLDPSKATPTSGLDQTLAEVMSLFQKAKSGDIHERIRVANLIEVHPLEYGGLDYPEVARWFGDSGFEGIVVHLRNP